jgi:hypothetical protein
MLNGGVSARTAPAPLTALAAVALVAAGCAAMKRTWHFQAAPVASAQVLVTPGRIGVAQKSAYVSFRVRNTSAVPAVVEAGTFVMRLPDGTAVTGHTSFLTRGYEGARGLLVRVGWADAQGRPAVPPGGEVEIALNFRQYGRDLRRHPRLTIALDGLVVDGKPAALPPLVLTAPPEAPMGEDI